MPHKIVNIRKANPNDLLGIFRVEKRSYPPWLQASHDVLKRRMNNGCILVAEKLVRGKRQIVGFSTFLPVRLSRPKIDLKQIMLNRHPHYEPWFQQWRGKAKPNTLWVFSTAVETKYQNQGIGGILIEGSLRAAKQHGLSYRASALKCEFATKRNPHEKIEGYLERVKNGQIKDRFLQPYVKRGFELVAPLLEYEMAHPRQRPKPNLNYNILAIKKIE